MCAHVYMCICVHLYGGQNTTCKSWYSFYLVDSFRLGGKYLYPPSHLTAPHPYIFRQGLSVSLELIVLARLAGQQALSICLSPSTWS